MGTGTLNVGCVAQDAKASERHDHVWGQRWVNLHREPAETEMATRHTGMAAGLFGQVVFLQHHISNRFVWDPAGSHVADVVQWRACITCANVYEVCMQVSASLLDFPLAPHSVLNPSLWLHLGTIRCSHRWECCCNGQGYHLQAECHQSQGPYLQLHAADYQMLPHHAHVHTKHPDELCVDSRLVEGPNLHRDL